MRHVQQLKSRLLGRRSSSSHQDQGFVNREPSDISDATSETTSEGVQKGQLGLFELTPTDSPTDLSAAQTQSYRVDVVAVHGLNGDAFSTWRDRESGILWLRDLLPQSLPGCRVYTYGYPSKVFSESMARVQECARNLLVSLAQLRDDASKGYRPLIFICHSLGGIIFKQALVTAHEDRELYGHVLESVVGVIFLGTPHRGSAAADFGIVAATIVKAVMATAPVGLKPKKVRANLLHLLQYDSLALQDLSISVRDRLGNISVVSCFETKPTPPLDVLIVDRGSATLSIPYEQIIPMDETHKTICRFPSRTASYMNVEQALQRIASKVSMANSKSPELEKSSTHSSQIVLTDLERRCMSLLNEGDSSRHTETPSSPISGTCQWIRTHRLFTTWLEAGRNAILWLTGRPGSGKTTLSWSLLKYIDDARVKSRNAVIFLCQNKNAQTSATAVVIGLILQVIDRHRSLIRHVRSVFERQGASMIQSFSLLWRIFLGLIQDPKVGVLYIILDALDECEQSSRQQLLEAIFDFLADPPQRTRGDNRVKFLFTSRPYLHESYVGTKQVSHSRISIDDDSTGYSKDLETFIRKRVNDISEKRQYPTETRDYLYQAIDSKADRTFLWIQVVLGSVENSLLTSRKDLQRILMTIPDDLSATYRRYLSSIPREHHEKATELLQLLLTSSRPLNLEEVNIAFTIDETHRTTEDVQEDAQQAIAHTVQSILGPLVTLSNYQNSERPCISLAHLSLKDFLLEETLSKADKFPTMKEVTKENSALRLATVCVQYLLLDDFDTNLFGDTESSENSLFELPGLIDELPADAVKGYPSDESDHHLHPDVLFQEKGALVPDICELLRSKYALYEYASMHWAEHFAVCEELSSDELRSGMMTLLDVNTAPCRNWLQFYREVATDPIDDSAIDQDSVVLASQFNFAATLGHLLDSQQPSQAVRDRSLYWASRRGHERIVATLLHAGADPNARSLDRDTALTTAAERGNLACVTQLLADARIDPNFPGRHGRNALSYACGGGHLAIVKKLLSRSDCRADDPDNSGATPFFWAVGGEHESVMTILRKQGRINMNHQDKTKRTAISWAAGDGDAQVLSTLLTFKGIDVNTTDLKGRSPLSWAAGNGHVDTARLLLRSRTIDNASVDKDKRGAISWASAGGHSEVVVCLLNAGCPGVDEEDIDGWTPLAWAIQMDSPATVQALIDSGLVELDRQDRAGRTALSWAVEYGHAKVVETLLQAGANTDIETKAGNTPVSTARAFGRDDLVERLMAARSYEGESHA